MKEINLRGTRNGELLWKMKQNHFSILITADQNLQYQQSGEKIMKFELTVIVLPHEYARATFEEKE